MVATGTHRATTSTELEELLGPYYSQPPGKIFIHDCMNNLTQLGETSRGTPVYVNSQVLTYDLVIPMGVVEPHYFAGYAGPLGCCKSLSVGVAGYQTVENNHKMAIKDETYCGRFDTNPLAQDLSEIAGIIEERLSVFCIGYLLKGWDIIDVFVGGRLSAFPAAQKAMGQASRIQPDPADILIVSQGGYPRDLDLYQSQKSVEHTKYAVKEGGHILWLAECSLGLGHGLERIKDVLEKPANQVLKMIRKKYRLGMHKIFRLLKVTQRANISLYSSIEGTLPQALKVNLINDPQAHLDNLLKNNPNATINVVPEGNEIFTLQQ